jgi:molybdenum cofactor cytidylyltransferase
MMFGEMPVDDAVGAILAHSVAHNEGVYKKGKQLASSDLERLKAAGIQRVFAARLEVGDVAEDEAAQALGEKVGGAYLMAQQPSTGRANLYASRHGVLMVDSARVTALNRIHEGITLATLPPFSVVEQRQMAATIKIVPFAVARSVLDQALAIIGDVPIVSVAPFRPHAVGLVISTLPRNKPSLVQKSETSMRDRVNALGSTLSEVIVCEHRIVTVRDAVAKLHAEGCNPILVFGASAIVDRGDVVPASVVAAGGRVVHLGMPVDPGNLMMFAKLQDVPVIGVPSCARSPKVNGFDWVLERVLAGVPMGEQDIMDMGPGGLLAEISSRPSPREGVPVVPRAAKIMAIVLAAGKSSRMGSNKLLADLGGKPLVLHCVENLKASAVHDITVVTGNEAEKVSEALKGLDVKFVHNAQFADGLSKSLKSGLANVGSDIDGVLIALGDMPLVDARTVDRLIAAFSVADHRTICVPVHEGKRGNPVLWGRQHFVSLQAVEGDQGGRLLMDSLSDEIVEVEVPSRAVLVDVDTPLALGDLRLAMSP